MSLLQLTIIGEVLNHPPLQTHKNDKIKMIKRREMEWDEERRGKRMEEWERNE